MTSNIMELAEPIKKAAKTVAFQWPGVVDADDLEQDLLVHLMERDSTIEKLLADFDNKQLLNAIIKIGHQIAAQERTDYEIFSGNFRYSVDEVRKILEDRALHNEEPSLGSNWSISEDFIKGGEFEDAVLYKSSSEIDLMRGMERLRKKNVKYAEIIERRYLKDASLTDGIDRKQLSRALTSLTTEMNRSFKEQQRDHEDGPGTRKRVSRSAAYAKSATAYDGNDFDMYGMT